MSRELDEACARALGWSEIVDKLPSEWQAHGVPPIGTPEREIVDRAGLKCVIPAYSANHAATRQLEDEIERRGLWWQYLNALHTLVNGIGFDGHGSLWYLTTDHLVALLRATPEQRARAFLEAV